MTPGQRRAVSELHRLRAVGQGFDFEEPVERNGWLLVPVSVRIGPLVYGVGGLRFREREKFFLQVPGTFPFAKPGLVVDHMRFAEFDHVTWGKSLCLYQSELEWDPGDGLYGFFTRLSKWLGRAALNDMDPVDGPLEPPHHATDSERTPFLFTADAPVASGTAWMGLAETHKHPNRLEVRAWHDSYDTIPEGSMPVLTVILPKRLPMEFPLKGRDFFKILDQQGFSRDLVLRLLQLSANHGDAAEPTYVVLGAPSRRAPDGSPRQHFAVWATDRKKSLRLSQPIEGEAEDVAGLRKEVAADLLKIFEETVLKWCPVFDERSEIVVRRDQKRPMASFTGKRVLVLGAGALGSWTAEFIARADPALLHIVDKAQVKPGLLVRQAYARDDIGANKALALCKRLAGITKGALDGFPVEAHKFMLDDLQRTASYDLILDCTASRVLQMRLEHDWAGFGGRTPRMVSFVIDGRAEKVLGVEVQAGSGYGPWVAYLQLKNSLCRDKGMPTDFLDAFYSDRALTELFQPEPGCSDPTFAGSAADSVAAAASFLNLIAIPNTGSWGYALTSHAPGEGQQPIRQTVALDSLEVVTVGSYRLFLSSVVCGRARQYVLDNNKKRSRRHETGGLLWGYWDDAARVIVVLEASGPPPDSQHDPGHFVCGTKGTKAQHARLRVLTRDACGFVGMWHTHPDMAPHQSGEDIAGMCGLVTGVGQNRRRALMMIFGRRRGRSEAGLYAYESIASERGEHVEVGQAIIPLKEAVV